MMSLRFNELLKTKLLRHYIITFLYLFLLFWIFKKSVLFDIGMAALLFWNPFYMKFSYLIPSFLVYVCSQRQISFL